MQLGGNDPGTLAAAAALALGHVGDACVEVNLNCGCPSDVVAARHEFGARLMLKPDRVREIVAALDRVPRPARRAARVASTRSFGAPRTVSLSAARFACCPAQMRSRRPR